MRHHVPILGNFPGGPQQYGAAVVTALLILALAASSATWLLQGMDNWIERVAVQRERTQALALQRSAQSLASLVLAIDIRRSSHDSPDEDWARALPPMRIGDFEISGQLQDLQGRFNLNSLRHADGRNDDAAITAYRRLLAQLGLPDELASGLVRRLGDPAGALLLWQELAAVDGYSPAIRERLAAHATVLPGRQAINVNTASAELLAAIQPGLDLERARSLIRFRQTQPFAQPIDYRRHVDQYTPLPTLVPFGTASQHFLAQVQITGPRNVSRIDTLLQRQPGTPTARILWTQAHE